MLLSGLLGNETSERVLLFIESYGTGYPSGIAKAFGISVGQVQQQVERLEREGVLSSRLVGRTRVYAINPRYIFREELSLMLKKALKHLPEGYVEEHLTARARPRRRCKAL